MTLLDKVSSYCLMMSALSFGCSTGPQTVHSEQESLGKGIVLGSITEQSKQQTIFTSWPSSLTVKGQVSKIEGAAYLVTNAEGREIRLPVDQDTMIDRPAHIGDWIKAYTDSSGRALQIRNVDQEMMENES
ncbi:MAG: hypothetical protein ACPGYT_04300 [Nitrospirales bacterium]